MCDITLALTLGATLLGAAGTIQQGQATAAASEYNAKVGDMNARLSERRARDAIERGAAEEQKKRTEVQQILGEQRAASAANGVDLTFGSPLDTLMDTAMLGELDALTIRTNTYREAYDRRVDAANQRAGAELNRMEGRAAKTGSYLSAAGTILGGAGKAYGQYKSTRIGRIE
jgi:hypothetical protein